MSSSRPDPPEIASARTGPTLPRVELVLEDVGLERRPVLRHQDVAERAERDLDPLVEAEDRARVLGFALVVLLAVGLADLWRSRHDDAGLGAVHAGLPGALRADLAVGVLLRLLAEVPDVPVTVLGVPVERVLDHLAVLAHHVVHDRGGDAEDLSRLVGDGDLDLLLAALAVGFAVDPAAARRHRPVRVVDPLDEVRGIELDRLAPLRERLLRLPAAASCEQEGCGEEREGAPSRRRRHRRHPARSRRRPRSRRPRSRRSG